METKILGIRISIFLDFGLLARFQILPAGGVWGGMRADFCVFQIFLKFGKITVSMRNSRYLECYSHKEFNS